MTKEQIDAKCREMEAAWGGSYYAIKDSDSIYFIDSSRLLIDGRPIAKIKPDDGDGG